MNETATKTYELFPTHRDLPGCYVITSSYGDALGDVELQPDGTWTGDTSMGVAAPSRPFATLAEAVAYCVRYSEGLPVEFTVTQRYYDGPLDPA